MGDALFGLLTGGASFDASRFRKDISAFEQSKEQQRDGPLDKFLAAQATASKRQAAGSENSPAERDPLSAAEPGGAHDQDVRVTGARGLEPLEGFETLADKHECSRRLLENLARAGFQAPTAIQKHAIPCVLAQHDLYAIAPTGSGKTIAFLLPIMMDAMRGKASRKGRGPRALVLSPTRELAAQTMRVLQLLVPGTAVKASLLAKSTAAGTAFTHVDVLVATPLLLVECLQAGKITLRHLRTLVLDEADKLFEAGKGFLEQVDAVFAACAACKRLTRCLFSATLPEWVEQVAGSVLQEPVSVIVGAKNAACRSVAQSLRFVGKEAGKLVALRQMVAEGLDTPVLVFVSTKERAKQLHQELKFERIHCDYLSADQSQAARGAAVQSFRAGKTWMLIATDLMGRGMDFLGVNTVVNYDFPGTKTDYIHRIGRTGRAGRKGTAVTFFAEDDAPRLQAIAECMRGAGCEVPDWMLLLKRGSASATTAPISDRAAFEKRQRAHRKQIAKQSKAKRDRELDKGGADKAVRAVKPRKQQRPAVP